MYTAVGAVITVRGEDIYVSQVKPGTGEEVRYYAVPAARRRSTRRRQLLQDEGVAGDDGDIAGDASITMDCDAGRCLACPFSHC